MPDWTLHQRVSLHGGPFDGTVVVLTRTPAQIDVAGFTYEQITDPDDGSFLGGYIYLPRER